MRKLASVIAVLLVAVLLLMPATQVLAIEQPDDPPQITAVYVFEDLLEDGDLGVLIDYYIDYTIAGIPPETVTESYLASFIDDDGITQLGTIAPYTFVYAGYTDKGYGRGIVWIYLTAAEVSAAVINKANMANHEVWLMGNPTIESGWTGDPPKTVAGIDQWWETDDADPAVILADRVKYLAQQIETAWGYDMIAGTTLGNRLTAIGELYFPNAINGLRTMAPTCFVVSTVDPILEDIDYSTAFGATIAEGTGDLPVTPLDLNEGDNTVDIDGAGTFILELTQGTEGEAVSIAGGCTVVNSPMVLVAGLNTIETNWAGTQDILVTVNLVDTLAVLTDTVEGTGFDASLLAVELGVSTWLLTSVLWLILTVVICAAYLKGSGRMGGIGSGSSKGLMIIFDICVVIGIVLGLLHIVVGILLGILALFLTGFILFYRRASF